MRRRDSGQAMVELAVALPALLLLLLGTIEVGNAINSYLTVNEISRDAARLVARHGSAADLAGLLTTESSRLSNVSISSNGNANNSNGSNGTLRYQTSNGTDASGNPTTSVEIDYDYQFIFANVPFMSRILTRAFTLRAITTMAIP